MRTLRRGTARNILIFMTDSADGKTGKTGLTLTIKSSKAGSVFSVITPTVTERSDGWYQLALTASHTDTLGDFALNVTAVGADPSDILMDVVSHDLTAIGSNAFVASDLVIEAVTSQTVFILTGGPANDVASVMAIIKDTSASGAQVIAEGSYVGGTRTLTLTAATTITVTTSDTITLVAVVSASNSVTIATGGITNTSFAASAIDAASLANDAVAEIQNGLALAATVASSFGTVNSTLAALVNYTDTEVAAILATVTSEAAKTTAIANAIATEATKTTAISNAVDALPLLSEILSGGDIDGMSIEQALKLIGAALLGKVAGGGTTAITFRALDDSKVRITATVDEDGNRTAITLDAAG